MKNLIQLAFCIIFSSSVLSAQDFEVEKPLPHFPKYSLGFTPSAVVNRFPGIQISLDRRINEKLTIASEYAITKNMRDDLPKNGYRFKLGIQHIYRQKENYFLTYGVNFITRKSSRFDRSSTANIASIFSENVKSIEKITHSKLYGFEFTQAIHYCLTKDSKVELGYGVGIGNSNDKVHTEITTRQGTKVFDRNESNSPIITSFHVNISHVFAERS